MLGWGDNAEFNRKKDHENVFCCIFFSILSWTFESSSSTELSSKASARTYKNVDISLNTIERKQ